ncbi:MAG: AlkA N-terminal domain-containing protein [Myxococcota bacterium]
MDAGPVSSHPPDAARLADVLTGELPPAACYRLLAARDVRFDGRFFVGVTSTGIFCRPICPAPTPKAHNCTFWRSAAAAQAAGFRPCLRCRPEAAPGTPAWRGTGATVSRALRLIEGGALDGAGSVADLAARLGIGDRHLRRLFDRHLGTNPAAVARLRRVLFAKQLLDETRLPMTEVALAAGFTSQRRFNACLREVYGQPPSALRRARRLGAAKAGPLRLSLPYRPPFAWDALVGFLRGRAIPGVESVDGARYARAMRVGDGVATVRVANEPERSRLGVEVVLEGTHALFDVARRLRRLFDLEADPVSIDDALGRVRSLARHVQAVPGVRVPGAVDGFETAVRAVLGQQVSVKGATTISGRIVERFGTPLPARLVSDDAVRALFPTPETLVEAPLETVGLPRARAETIRGLAAAVLERPSLLDPAPALDDAIADWSALRGIGPWTAHYVAMRVLGEPDGLPVGDLGLRKALAQKRAVEPVSSGEVEKRLEPCRPYRAYAALRLWDGLGGG